MRRAFPWLVLPLIVGSTLGCAPTATSSTTRGDVPRYSMRGTEVRTLPRSGNGQSYELYVGLPFSYGSDPQKRYPVLYMCDGYWDFALVRGSYGNLNYDKVIPEFIIVGFSYQGDDPNYEALRTVDYSPTAAPDRPSGGGPAFLGVIEKEIIPFVERSYRVDSSYRVLGGTSLGGLFTLYTMFNKPDLFQAYIAISPAAIWGGGWLLSHETAFASGHKTLPTRLFMTGAAEEDPSFLNVVKLLDGQFRQHNYGGFTYEFRLVEGEKHAGTKAESYTRGVRYAFAPRVVK